MNVLSNQAEMFGTIYVAAAPTKNVAGLALEYFGMIHRVGQVVRSHATSRCDTLICGGFG